MVEDEIIMPVECALGVIWDTNSDCLVNKVVKRSQDPEFDSIVVWPNWVPGSISNASEDSTSASVAVWYWLGW